MGDAQRVCNSLHRHPSFGNKIGGDIRFFESASEMASGRIANSIVWRPSMRSQLADAVLQFLHFRIADNRLVKIHGCSAYLAQKSAAPVKQIGCNVMAASGRRYHLARSETVLNDCQLLLGCPPSAADITFQQFNQSILGRYKPLLEPFCLCRLSGRKWGSSNLN